jgi:lysozyme family protein
MVTATKEQLEPTYHQEWDAAKVRTNWQDMAASTAAKIYANKGVYQQITAKTGVPYWWIGPVHNLEGSLNFKTHLHNGDPLTARTRQVPPGRPATGSPPFSFADSAVDALTMAPHKLEQVTRWSVERSCYEWERYNGFGYLKRGPSPYLWSGTNQYDHGKYVADGVYSDTAVSKQLGAVAVVRELAKLDQEVANALKDREPGPPPAVIEKETKGAKDGRKTGGAITGAGAAGQATNAGTQQPDKPHFISPVITFTAIGVGIALMIMCTIIISRKAALVNAKWGQS